MLQPALGKWCWSFGDLEMRSTLPGLLLLVAWGVDLAWCASLCDGARPGGGGTRVGVLEVTPAWLAPGGALPVCHSWLWDAMLSSSGASGPCVSEVGR